MFRKILLAVDGSDHSMIAADYAAGMAKTFGATVFLVHAYPHTSDLLGYEDFERLVARRKSAGQAILNKVRKRLEPKDVTILEDLLEGPEAEAILSRLDPEDADVHAGLLHDADGGADDVLQLGVVAEAAAGVEEDLGRLLGDQFHVQPLGVGLLLLGGSILIYGRRWTS